MKKPDTKEIKKRFLLREPNKILSIGESLEVASLCDAYDEAQKELTQLRNESFKRLSDLLSCKQLLRDTMKRIQKELGEG